MHSETFMYSSAQDFVTRKHNAAQRFINYCIDHAELSQAAAIDVLALYIKAKYVKLNGSTGEFTVTRGALLDAAILQRAAREIRSGGIEL